MSITSEFTPFNDAPQVVYIPTDSNTGGLNTIEIDPFRQGVEIKTENRRFLGIQPKLWSGNDGHVTSLNAIGQARTFSEYTNSSLWTELPIFDPVAFIILGHSYPLPIIFNEGPQQQEETSIEPIVIPFKKNTNEGPFFAHRVAGELEDGNNFDTIFKNSNRITQFIDYLGPLQPRPFLDEGQGVWGELATGITTEGYTLGQEVLQRAFDDTTTDDIPQSTRATTDLLQVLIQMKMNLDLDLRPSGTKSAGANTFVYGRDSAIYGTDSYAFIGICRGS